jgi:hypothetical protein
MKKERGTGRGKWELVKEREWRSVKKETGKKGEGERRS